MKFEWNEEQTAVVVTDATDFHCPVGTTITNGDLFTDATPSVEWGVVKRWIAEGNVIDECGTDNNLKKQNAISSLSETDIPFVRVLEDLINVLVSKGVISLDDFNEVAKNKLVNRVTLRSML